MADVTARGLRFHVQQLGSENTGPTVVFVHGLVMDNLSSFYYTLAAPLARNGIRTILFDLRGHGLSARPETGYTPQDSALDLLAILDELGVEEPVYLLGNSYGGVVAMHAALKAAHRVAGVVLVEAACAGQSGELWVEDIVNTLSVAALGLEFDRTGEQLLKLGQRKVAKLAGNADALLNRTSLIDDLVSGALLSESDLRQVACPVLGVFGAESELAGAAKDLDRLVPGCETHVIPGLGHTVLREATGELIKRVLAWLDAVR
ncbi:alpha/beta fold hydrolase [Kibdelosporangium persicum]|uniref:Pimeloyl-ACP methyl ester carboxylesterase n=1 Tax=Kibdelosporangium persicum TaxID=2698649 RepID=A0ABX2F8C8_9PSEU|nr:alpha/beta hydrolase [Kibdelosporangium persicum]NRN67601.1 Pimeloyl-ACP methyl ester carboxylesterase [Kibdelosporangium persicum]